ncbi:hypothetical protein GCM10027074_57340 [Streptomyces deserti]
MPGPEDCPPHELSNGWPPSPGGFGPPRGPSARGRHRADPVAWMRVLDGQSLDAAAVTTLTDVLPPALYAPRRTPHPVPPRS